MGPSAFEQLIDKVAEADNLDDARHTVEMGKFVNQLKSDPNHSYVAAGPVSRSAAVDIAALRADERLSADA